MGEFADAILMGECCAFCMAPFVYEGEIFEHGYPVACNECYEPDCGYQKQDKSAKAI